MRKTVVACDLRVQQAFERGQVCRTEAEVQLQDNARTIAALQQKEQNLQREVGG